METGRRGDLTVLLEVVRAGREGARDQPVRSLYAELGRLAVCLMRHERPGHTPQPRALVHEALLRLLRGEALDELPNRRYLFATAARAMRPVLADHARRRRARKRCGCLVRVPLDGTLAGYEERDLAGIALHEALEGLAPQHPRQAQVVEPRYFGGLTVPEVAATLEVSDTAIEGDRRFARAWLRGRLGGSGP